MPPRAQPNLRSLPLEATFPVLGKIENMPYGKQPPQSYVDGLNVMPQDVAEDRVRGGQRPGTPRYIDSLVNSGGDFIQNLQRAVRLLNEGEPSQDALLGDSAFTASDNTAVETLSFDTGVGSWGEEFHIQATTGTTQIINGPLTTTVDANRRWLVESNVCVTDYEADITSNPLGDVDYIGIMSVSGLGGIYGPANTVDGRTVAILDVDITVETTGIDTTNSARYVKGFYVRGELNSSQTDEFFIVGYRYTGTDTRLIIQDNNATTADVFLDSVTLSGDEITETAHRLRLVINGNNFFVYWDNVLKISHTVSLYNDDDHFRFGLCEYRQRDGGTWTDDNVGNFDNFAVYSGTAPDATDPRDANIAAVSEGDIYTAKVGDTSWTAAVDGTDALDDTKLVESVPAFGDVLYVDGTGYKRLTVADLTVRDWDATSGTLPGGNGSDSGDGVPRAQIIALHQGRIALARFADNSADVSFSAIGNHFDWDETGGGTPTEASAVSLSTNELGTTGDVVTNLTPQTRNRLIIGGERTIHVLVGNPGASALLDPPAQNPASLEVLSREIGIAGPRATAVSPDQTVYFFSGDGLYAFTPNDFDIDKANKISDLKLDNTFKNIDTSANQVQLLWDLNLDGLHIFVTPILSAPDGAASQHTHFFYHRPTKSFHPWRFPDNHGPSAVLAMDDTSSTTRTILLGGIDSYVRVLDTTDPDDDGTAIASRVLLGPIRWPRPGHEVGIHKIMAVLDEQSDSVDFEVRAADTVEAASTATAVFTGTFSAGRNAPNWNRGRGAAIFIELSNDTLGETWAFEELTAELMQGPMLRPRSQ